MSAPGTKPIFQLSIGHVMLAIAVIAAVLAPVVEAVKNRSGEQVFLLIVFDLFILPLLLTLVLYITVRPDGTRDRAISTLWHIMSLAYVLLFLSMVLI